jgi:homoserine O-acetyltransferase
MTLSTASEAGVLGIGAFTTEGGAVIPGAQLRYRTWGDPELGRRHGWIVVVHALTGNADVDLWWDDIIGPGRPLDTERHAVLATNLLGSCYGSTGPASGPFASGTPFPRLTTADLARAHFPVLSHLNVERLALVTGASLGGMVALQLGRLSPVPIDRLVVFAAPATTSAQSIAWNAAQRMAIEADPRWRDGAVLDGDPPAAGLAAARAIAMITYRSAAEFDARFGRAQGGDGDRPRFSVDQYLRRHGDKLVERFDARSYVALTHAMDAHTVGDWGDAARSMARRVGRVTGVGVDTDVLYPAAEVRAWVSGFQEAGLAADYREIRSICGHDAFLIEFEQVREILRG